MARAPKREPSTRLQTRSGWSICQTVARRMWLRWIGSWRVLVPVLRRGFLFCAVVSYCAGFPRKNRVPAKRHLPSPRWNWFYQFMKKVKPKNNQRNNQYCAHLLFPTAAHTPTNKPCLNGGERNSKQRKNYSVIQKTGKEWKVRLIHTRQRLARCSSEQL